MYHGTMVHVYVRTYVHVYTRASNSTRVNRVLTYEALVMCTKPNRASADNQQLVPLGGCCAGFITITTTANDTSQVTSHRLASQRSPMMVTLDGTMVK
jgi:hypothetical protein